jgi:hypothetical protein
MIIFVSFVALKDDFSSVFSLVQLRNSCKNYEALIGQGFFTDILFFDYQIKMKLEVRSTDQFEIWGFPIC